MTEILVKLFVKDSENISNKSVRTAYGVLASAVGIISNIILFTIKFILGLLINSISVTADAFNNLTDAVSSIIIYIGVKMANKPADEEHPFGHGRYEYVAAFIVSFLILQVGWSVLKTSFNKIIEPSELRTDTIHIIFLALSILVKVWLVIFNKKLDKKVNSTIMRATVADSIGDIMITSMMVLSIIIQKIFNLQIDGYMGLVVGIFIIVSGIGIAKDTLMPLIGEAIDVELYSLVKDKVESYDGIVGSHDLIIHSYGPTSHMATIHVEVPNDADINHIHEIIDEIEKDVLEEFDICLVIHTDPIEINDQSILNKKEKIEEIVAFLEPEATIHDFRVVYGEKNINIIFEMVVPYSYTKKMEQDLLIKLMETVREIDSKYQCVVMIENSFVNQG